MDDKILSGVEVANSILDKLKLEIDELKKKHKIEPTLAVVNVGKNPASKVYISKKEQKCKQLGINSLLYQFDEHIDEYKLIKKIKQLNEDKKVHGILVQLPLPKHINQNRIILSINPKKDVDGFHPINIGNLAIGDIYVAPCTPLGIMEILKYYNIDLEGKDVVIINHSNVVGKPLALMMLNKNATVCVCHEYTSNLETYTKKADILIVGVGKPKFTTKDMIKNDSILVDVGINRVDKKLVGDVDFEEVYDKCKYITPVPGGVGPMTVCMLMKNTIEVYKKMVDRV